MSKKLLALLLTGVISLGLAAPALADSNDNPTETEFTLSVNDVTKSITLSQLGVSVTEVESDDGDALAGFFSWFGKASLIASLLEKSPSYEFTWSELRSEDMVRNLWDLDRPKNARFVENDGNLSIEAETDGYEFDVQTLLEEITNDYPNFDDYELELTEADIVHAAELMEHFDQVQTLLQDGLTITVNDTNYKFPAQLKDIAVVQESNDVHLSLSAPYLNYVTSTLDELTHSEASNMVIWEAPESSVGLANTEGHLKNGQDLDLELTEKMISGAISSGETTATGVLTVTQGQIFNQTGMDLGDLELLATGISDFSTSPSGRDFNVRKALNEHINGIIIPAGATYNFNDFLGPVTYSAGWEGSLAIFSGNQLKTVPGGGICQTSTTVYRAALNAGLDIQEQRNHSLYVHYYEAYGDGLDSTIYPGSQDLVFVNNTDGPILIEAYAEDTIATVNFYGTSDGRNVELFGPYTQSNQTDHVISATGGLGYNQIAWQQVITWPDGRVEDDWRISTYNGAVTQY